ncbi:AAA family ATPase [Paraglaciecola agarilytica]|uniref:ATP-dependent nuclease n=1 Tax=Paraglaciecola chathamensis TaxID=368405 RepID=UPI001C08703B|nr:AAA family ATPase [Paraglaciecola agarilytica]MBU3018211.1 AAA family ATPase [Paraglaciecola agarilytica]
MHIEKLVVKNFKKFTDRAFDFNKDLNLLVGDNDSGKSTIQEAIEIALNCSYRGKPLSSEIKPELFNLDATTAYIEGDKRCESLPSITIELFLDGIPEYRGDNNSLNTNTDGVSLKIKFDDDLKAVYNEFIRNPDSIKSIPVEFFKIEWLDFGWNKIKFLNRKMSGLFVDPSRLHPTQGRNQYISRIINSSLSKEEHALLNVNYRQLKQHFDEQPQVKSINDELDKDNIVTNKKLEVTADVSISSFESGMQLSVDNINLPQIGKGEQNTIQIKLAIQNKASNADVILLEEPENHLSHTNLSKLVKYIECQRQGKQLFITTHSSYVLNKLSLNKLCLIHESYIRLNDIDKSVSKSLKRLPGYDTLRVVLSKHVVLVEGPSDELVLKRIYIDIYDRLPEDDGIDIIVVRGIGFKNYLEIAKNIGTSVHVVKDNDGNHKDNIEEYKKKYDEYKNIEFFSISDNEQYSLEPVLICSNNKTEEELDEYAKITLSTQTYNKYIGQKSLDGKVRFLKDWYADEGGAGKKKVDSAMRIFESENKINYPEFLQKALRFE